MSELENINTKRLKPVKIKRERKPLIKLIFSLFIFASLFQTVLYFFATPILKEFIRAKIKSKSQGLYELDFDRLTINLSTRSFKIEGFKLTPNAEVFEELCKKDKAKNALYQIKFKDISLENIRVARLFRRNVFEANILRVNQPEIKLVGVRPEARKRNKDFDPIHEDIYPAIAKYFKALKINKAIISNGHFDFYSYMNRQKKKTFADNISITLTGVSIDSVTHSEHKKVFYSDNVDIIVDNYTLSFKDNIHSLKAGKIHLSTKRSLVEILDIYLEPNQASYETLKNKDKAIYKAYFPEVVIRDVKLNELYFNNNLTIEKILLNNASFELVGKKSESTKARRKGKYDLYDLIAGMVEFVQVDTFSLQNASFKFKRNFDDSNATASIKNMSISLNDFYIDSVAYQNKDKILYSSDLVLNIEDYKMIMGDQIHTLSASHVKVDSKNRIFNAQNVTLRPDRIGLKYARDNNKKLYDISIPNLALIEADLHLAYNYKNLNVNTLKLSYPQLNIDNYQDSSNLKNKKENKKGDLHAMVSPFLNKISIQKISLDSGKFDLSQWQDTVRTGFSEGKIDMKIFNFAYSDEYLKESGRRLFYGDKFQATLSDYRLKMNDKLHKIEINSVYLSSEDSVVKIIGLELKPDFDKDFVSNLKSKDKNQLFNFRVPSIDVFNIDLAQALISKNLKIDSIIINQPKFEFQSFAFNKRKELIVNTTMDTTSLKLPKDSISPVKNFINTLGKQLNSIDIHYAKLDRGDLEFLKKDSTERTMLTSKNMFSVVLKEFHFVPDSIQNNEEFLYSEDIILYIDKYKLDSPDKLYSISADNIEISTEKKYLEAHNIDVTPNKSISDSLKLSSVFKITLPEVKLKGFDFREVYKKKAIIADTAVVDAIQLTMSKNKDFKSRNRKVNPFTLRIPASLSKINFSVVQSKATHWKGIYGEDFQNPFFNAKIDFTLKNFLMDSSLNDTLYANFLNSEQQTATLTDFWQIVADSTHKLKCDTILLNSQDNHVKLKGLAYVHLIDTNNLSKLKYKKKSSLYNIQFGPVDLSGLDLIKFNRENKIYCDNFSSNQNLFDVHSYPGLGNKKSDGIKNVNLWQIVKPIFDGVYFKNIDLNESILKISTHTSDKDKSIKFNDIGIQFAALAIDSVNATAKDKYFYANDAKFTINNWGMPLSGGKYKFQTTKIKTSLADSTLEMNDFKYIPKNRDNYTLLLRGQKNESFNALNGRNMNFKGFDFFEFIDNKRFVSKSAILNDFDLIIHYDRLAQKGKKDTSFVQDMLLNISQLFVIDSLGIQNGKVVYEEYVKELDKPGRILISDLNGSILNLRNDTNLISSKLKMEADINANFYDGKVGLHLSYFIKDTTQNHYLEGSISNFQMDSLNEYLTLTTPVAIEKGTIENLNFNFRANRNQANGSMHFKYKNLKIRVLEKPGDTIRERKLFMSFVANRLLKRNSPKLNILTKPKIISCNYNSENVFTYWWKAIQIGLKSSLGFTGKKIKKVEKKEEERNEQNMDVSKKIENWYKKSNRKLLHRQKKEIKRPKMPTLKNPDKKQLSDED